MQKFFFGGQGSLEYLLVIGLVVLISALVIMVLPSDVFSPKSSVSSANNAFDNLRWGGVSAISLVDVDSVSSGGGVLQLSSVSGVEGVLLSVYSGGVLLGSGSKDINLSPAYDCSSDLVLVSSSGKQVISKDKINCGGGSISSLVVGFVVPPSNFILVGDCVGLQNISNNLGASYRLTRSFDCSGFGDFVSIGSGVSPFTGVFDGAGFTVSGLVLVPGVDGLGLFGFVDGGGVVENLVLDGVGVVSGSFGNSFVSGGRVSFSEESDKCAGWLTAKLGSGAVRNGFVYNVPVSPNNTAGFLGVGGLVGCMYANSSVLRCSSSSPVVSVVDNAGGLVGYNSGGTITDSNATGSVSGPSNVGGLVGYQQDGSITNSFATGNVTGTTYQSNNVGGLVGYLKNASVLHSYASGIVHAPNNSHGNLIGSADTVTLSDVSYKGILSPGDRNILVGIGSSISATFNGNCQYDGSFWYTGIPCFEYMLHDYSTIVYGTNSTVICGANQMFCCQAPNVSGNVAGWGWSSNVCAPSLPLESGVSLSTPYLWVADSVNNKVIKYDSATGTVINQYGVGNYPVGVAVDSSGNVWVANRDSNTVTHLDGTNGTIMSTSPLDYNPIAITIDAYGNVWVANDSNAYLTKLRGSDGSKAGIYLGAAKYYYMDAPIQPLRLSSDINGNVWVLGKNGLGVVLDGYSGDGLMTFNVDHSANDFVVDTANQKLFIRKGGNTIFGYSFHSLHGGLSVPNNPDWSTNITGYGSGHLALDKDGNVWVASYPNSLDIFNGASGTKAYSSLPAFATYMNGSSISFDSSGNAWVIKKDTNAVKTDSKGNVIGQFGASTNSTPITSDIAGDTGFAYQYFVLGRR